MLYSIVFKVDVKRAFVYLEDTWSLSQIGLQEAAKNLIKPLVDSKVLLLGTRCTSSLLFHSPPLNFFLKHS